jgi:hypothetical protein
MEQSSSTGQEIPRLSTEPESSFTSLTREPRTPNTEPYEYRIKLNFLYYLISTFLNSTQEDNSQLNGSMQNVSVFSPQVFFLQYLLKLFIAEYHLTCTVQGFIYA